MGGKGKPELALLLAGAALLCGCGGSSSGETSSTASDPLAGAPPGPTREFIVPGGDNAVPLYGREATAAERRQASAVIHRWMRARAAKDWREDCRYFSKKYVKLLVADAHGVSEGRVKTCPQALAFFGPNASGDYVNTLSGPIDSLRVSDGLGFAQWHGKDGIDWEVPMDKEGGSWLVGKAAPISQEG